MTRYTFQPLPDESAVEAWRALDRAVYRWVIAHGGSPLLARVAAWASLADGEGDTALPLRTDGSPRTTMTALDADELDALRAQPLVREATVASPASPAPFVLDADGRFYLWRNHANESAVVAAIRARLMERGSRHGGDALQPLDQQAPRDGDPDDAELDALFAGQRDDTVAPQRAAVRNVRGRRLFVLTGGPGTGKTTTVLRMLLHLQAHAATPLAIRVAAPTGKAAQRLVQALRKGKRDLRRAAESSALPDLAVALAAIPDDQALTLHRLLGYQPHANTFRRGADDPIAADVVVVDEASMVDLAMLRSLLDALRPDAVLILVGDADQLASVAAGSVLRDLVDALEGGAEPVVVRLRHSFRAERELAAINDAIHGGDRAALDAAIAAAGLHATHHRVDTPAALAQALQRWSHALATTGELRAVVPGRELDGEAVVGAAVVGAAEAANESRHPPHAFAAPAAPTEAQATTPDESLVAAALDALARRQLLCARREGPFGAVAANTAIERRLRRAWGEDSAREWYAGRAVIVTRNDYALGLFNGDVGVCLAGADGHLSVWFETTPRAAPDGGEPVRTFRPLAPNALPAHEPAFAITIHKSQGSEYDHVAVLLPPEADSRILSRQLLYTGASRARRVLELWSGDAVLDAALATPVRRAGGLAARLAALAAQGAPAAVPIAGS